MCKEENTSAEWCFPENKGLPLTGFNAMTQDSLMEDPVDSLIRECCQNSLDASLNNGKPVEIAFNTFEMHTSDLPGVDELKRHINSCQAVNRKREAELSTPEKDFYDTAKTIIKSENLFCLRVSDFNTTGLQGSREKETVESLCQWMRCVRSIGCSGEKPDLSGGSKGLGKSTTFYNSAVRTVFFNTLDRDGYEASEGVSWLTSHCTEEGKIFSQGFYSCEHEGQPCRAIYAQTILDRSFKRKVSGTDIFIIGFNQNKKEFDDDHDMDTIVKNVVIDSFLPAIKAGKIVIRTDHSVISDKTLPEVMKYLASDSVPEKRKKQAKLNIEFNSVMDSEADIKTFDTDSLGIKGTFELKLFPSVGFGKRIAIYREVGMKIVEKLKRTRFDFAGVMTVKGRELNVFMKDMETSNHKKWQPDIYSGNKMKKARSVVNKLEEFIGQSLREIESYTNENEEIDSGLGWLLPDSDDFLSDGSVLGYGLNQFEEKKEFNFKNYVPKNRNVEETDNKEASKILLDENGDICEKEFSSKKLNRSSKVKTELLENKSEALNEYFNNEHDNDELSASKYETVRVNVSKVKMVPLDDSGARFKVSFVPEAGFRTAMIRFNVAGETVDYSLPIISARNEKGAITVENRNALVGLRLIKGKMCVFEIELSKNQFKSFSVNVDAYKTK